MAKTMAGPRTRIRFTIDVIYHGVELSNREKQLLANQITEMAHVVAFEDKSEDVDYTVDKVVYSHDHHSTEDEACSTCVRIARDEQNADT